MGVFGEVTPGTRAPGSTVSVRRASTSRELPHLDRSLDTVPLSLLILIGREAVEQPCTPGGLEELVAAAARRMRLVPGVRRRIVAQTQAIMVPEHRRAFGAFRPVAARHVLGTRERSAIGFGAGEYVVLVRRIAASVDDVALLGQRGLLV